MLDYSKLRCNNRTFVALGIDLSARRSVGGGVPRCFDEARFSSAMPYGMYDATFEIRWLIGGPARIACSRGPLHASFPPSPPGSPRPAWFLFRQTRVENREWACTAAIAAPPPFARSLANGIWAQRLCSRVHVRMYGCWAGRSVGRSVAEYNSGNTMELGQSCFDARLRSFHLPRPCERTAASCNRVFGDIGLRSLARNSLSRLVFRYVINVIVYVLAP